MHQRGISKNIIDSISPDEFDDNMKTDKQGNYILQIQLNGSLLRIFYRKEEDDIMIITAYKTSKLDKYRN